MADTPMSNSATAYRRSTGNLIRSAWRRRRTPVPQEPKPSPAMNVDRTIEVSAVVTPNCATARRSQTSSYRRLQNPETKKKTKNQPIPNLSRQVLCMLFRGCGLEPRWKNANDFIRGWHPTQLQQNG